MLLGSAGIEGELELNKSQCQCFGLYFWLESGFFAYHIFGFLVPLGPKELVIGDGEVLGRSMECNL